MVLISWSKIFSDLIFLNKECSCYIKNAKSNKSILLLLSGGSALTCDCIVCLFFFIINHPQSLSKCTYRTQINGTSCYESLPYLSGTIFFQVAFFVHIEGIPFKNHSCLGISTNLVLKLFLFLFKLG